MKTKTRNRSANLEWLVPAGLILLSAVPVLAGALRLGQLTGGAAVTPENARFVAAPLPVVIHIVGATVYALLGALQFAPNVRRRHPHWHRRSGWLLVVCGLATSLSGLWMAQFYPWPAGDGPLLYGMRLVVGGWMTLSLAQAVLAISRRQYGLHGVWMMRAYAIGLGAGTQVLTALAWWPLVGTTGELARNLIMGSGWLINALIVEGVIRRRLTRTGHGPAPARSPGTPA